jgi:putative flippase GtrA
MTIESGSPAGRVHAPGKHDPDFAQGRSLARARRRTMKLIQSQLFRFAVTGLSNTALSLAVIWCALRVFHLADAVANLAGYLVGFVCSFTLNRNWTFGHRGSIAGGLVRVALTYAVAYGANLAVLTALVAHFGAGAMWTQLPGMALYTVVCYLGLKFFAFPPSCAETARYP